MVRLCAQGWWRTFLGTLLYAVVHVILTAISFSIYMEWPSPSSVLTAILLLFSLLELLTTLLVVADKHQLDNGGTTGLPPSLPSF